MIPWRLLDRTGLVLLLLCPVFLVHGRALAEIVIAVLALLFLVRAAGCREWGWLRRGWVPLAALWWLWLLICSVLHRHDADLLQAIALARLFLFVAALEFWLLRDAARRVWLMWLVRGAALYIVAQEALQLVTGHNLFGDPRRPSGELTGPYDKARAAPVLSRIIFPAMLPPVLRQRVLGAVWVVGGVLAMVLFGQRMPLLLTLAGLIVAGLLLRRLRRLVIAALLAGAALVAASAVIVPPTFYRLVTKFSAQMADWPDSPYGQLAARGVAIAAAHPWTGVGFDGFRKACGQPAYFWGWHALHGTGPDTGGGAAICAQHPHNHYLQAVVEGGVPGLAMFCALVLAWLARLGAGLWRQPDPLRVGLFVAVLIQEWPLASASDFANMPLGGWFFLLLGIGLAERRWQKAAPGPI